MLNWNSKDARQKYQNLTQALDEGNLGCRFPTIRSELTAELRPVQAKHKMIKRRKWIKIIFEILFRVHFEMNIKHTILNAFTESSGRRWTHACCHAHIPCQLLRLNQNDKLKSIAHATAQHSHRHSLVYHLLLVSASRFISVSIA